MNIDIEIQSQNKNQLVISISQSGETLDTIEALKHAKKMGHKKTLAICNVQEVL